MEIMIVAGIIGLLAAIAIPNFVRARESAQLHLICNNLHAIEVAKDQYAMEKKKGNGQQTKWVDLSNYLKGATIHPVVRETYTLNKVGTAASARIRVKLGTYKAGSTITAR